MTITIGEFARLGGVSVRMLRHYDDLGLLRPAEVDSWTGRRRYAVGQLGTLNRIVTLKELGVPLAEVGALLGPGSTDRLRQVLTERRADLARQAAGIRHRMAQADARLRLLAGDGGATPPSQVQVRQVPAMRLVGLSDRLGPDDGFARAVEDQFVRVCDLMDAAGLSRLTPVSRTSPADADAVDVATGFEVTEDAPGLDELHLPAAQVATVVHQGPMATVHLAHQVLVRWAEEQGVQHAGRPRRTVFLEANGEDQGDWVVEVQLELG